MSIFDSLQSKINKQQKEQGIHPADLLTMTKPQRRVIRFLLRDIQMTHEELETAVSNLPPAQQLTPEELQHTLAILVENGLLLKMGQDKQISYRVDLRYKSGSKVSNNVWQTLETRLKDKTTRR